MRSVISVARRVSRKKRSGVSNNSGVIYIKRNYENREGRMEE